MCNEKRHLAIKPHAKTMAKWGIQWTNGTFYMITSIYISACFSSWLHYTLYILQNRCFQSCGKLLFSSELWKESLLCCGYPHPFTPHQSHQRDWKGKGKKANGTKMLTFSFLLDRGLIHGSRCLSVSEYKMFLKLNLCDPGWWRYQLNTNWWCLSPSGQRLPFKSINIFV